MEQTNETPIKKPYQINLQTKHAIAIPLIILATAVITTLATQYYLKTTYSNVISVTGKAKGSVKNEIARFTANVSAQNKDKNTAVDEITQKSTRVVEEIKKSGIPEDDIKTANLSIYQMQEPYWEDGSQKYRPGEWTATISVEIVVRDVTKVSDFASLLAGLETTDIYGPNLTYEDTTYDDSELFSLAMTDARTRAENLAEDAGRKLGKALFISENSGTSAYPYPTYDRGYGIGAGGGGGAMPIESGATDTYRYVYVTYELK